VEVLETRTVPAFVSASSFPGAGGATSMVVGDFNHDGNLDLAVASQEKHVNVFLGNGDGTFKPPTQVPTDTPVVGLAVGDVNGDGNLDLVACSSVDNKVVVLLGNGDGTFRTGVDYAVGRHPSQVLLADLTGTGKPDILTANEGLNGISHLANKGDGTFQANTPIAFVSGLGAMVSGHFFGDHTKLDLAVVYSGGALTGVALHGNGDGTFSESKALGAGDRTLDPHFAALAAAAADLNGDGNDDLIVYEAGVDQLEVFLGNGDGTVQEPVAYPVGQGIYTDTQIQVADLRHDGRMDVVVANPETNTVSVLLGNGDGSLQPAVTYVVGHSPDALVTGDFHGNGHLDIAIADYVGSDIEILQGTGTGTFQAAIAYGTGTGGATAIAAGDLNHDGKPDLVVANPRNNTVSVLLGNGDGSFQPPVTYPVGVGPTSVQLADLSGNGNLDIITANAFAPDPNHAISVLLGNGDGTFRPATYVAAGSGADAVVAADLIGDGKMDLAVTNRADRTLSILFGNGDGTFQNPVNYSTDPGPNGVVAGDLNGDGKLDLVVTNFDGGDVGVYLNQGGGNFKEATYYPDKSPSAPVLAALRSGGVLDLVTACANNSFGVLLGNGDGTFQPAANYASHETPVAVAVGEMDGDHTPDVAAVNQTFGDVRVFRGNGDGTFQEAVAYPGAGRTPGGMVAVDLTGDGQPDLAIADEGDVTQGVTIMRSQSATAVGFNLTALATPQPGVPCPFLVTAVNGAGQPIPSYSGTVHFTSNDPATALPADASLTNGTGTFSATFGSEGSDYLRATDTVNRRVTGTSQSFRWVDHFRIDAPATSTAGVAVNFTVTALDRSNQPITGYTGTVRFSCTDPNRNIPDSYDFTAGDMGVRTFPAILNSPGSQVMSVADESDPSKTGSATIVVASIHLAVTGFPTTVTAGASGAFSVTAEDANGNPVPSYSGTVHFTSSDPQAPALPDSTLTNGMGTFSLALKTVGSQSITATDTIMSSITGSERFIEVNPAPASALSVTGYPTSLYPGAAGTIIVTAVDPYGNFVPSYSATITLSSSDAAAGLPASRAIYSGTGTFSPIVLNTLGTQSITATDSNGLSGSQSDITVFPDPVTDFTLPTVGGGPRGIVWGPDGNLWFTENATNKVGYLTPAGAFTEFPVIDPESGVDPIEIVTGPDGNFWFTEFFGTSLGNNIASITPNGAVREFDLPTPNSNAQGLTLGPDGNLWFTETQGNRIGKLTPSGALHEYVLGANSFPVGITVGPDHNLWFVESRGNKIGRITPEGAITEFLIPTPASNPQGITAGPDGNLWFTEQGADQIGRITPAGQFTEFALPTASAGPHGITIGPDSNLWFTEFTADKIGRITVTGAVADVVTLASFTGPYDIVTGPDGNLWFSESNDNSIGRLVPPPTPGPQLVVTGFSSPITAGQAVTFTVTAEDGFGDKNPGYNGRIHFTSNDPTASLPPDTKLTNGTGTFHAVLDRAGSQTITATDTATSSLTGTSSAIQVNAGAASHFGIATPSGATVGVAFPFTLTALDPFGNTAAGYAGTVHFSSSDAGANLPADGTLAGGTGTFSATLNTAGNQTLTATDTATSSVTGTSSPITASLPPSQFLVSAPAVSTAGAALTVTVTALDKLDHLAAGYNGMVRFSSSDASANLPGQVALSNGTGTFSVILNKAGDQTITVTDTATSTLTGSATVTVAAGAADHLAFSIQATVAVLGGNVNPPFGVQIQDHFGNGLTADNTDAVTLSIVSGFGTFTPDSTTTLTVHAGLVNFTNLSFTAAGDYTLTASGPGGLSGGTITVRVARAGPPPSWLFPVASDLTHSAEYYTGVISRAYQRYLGRLPDDAGLQSWLTQMQHGLTDEHLEAGFIGSGEYIQSHGGAGAGWVQGMYQDLLGRTPAQAEVDHWLQVLRSGVSTVEVAYGFAASGEREGQRVTADYQEYLGRTPADSEVAGWVSAFESGSKTNEDVIAGFVGSAEYFQEHFGNAADWFASASQALFGTAATQSSSVPSYLYAVSATLSHSDEYYTGVITAAYQRYLGRLPDDAGLQSWLTQMQHGLTDEHLEAGFIGSGEYIQSHGGAGAGWVQGMYQDLLGRTPAQAEVDHWLQVLGSGVSTVEVAYGFAASGEREGQRVGADYQQYLGRTPADAEVAGWVGAFESGAKTNEDVIAGFAGSAEYFNRHNNTLQEWWNQAVAALFGAAGY
jgi:streptogramin lyase